LRRRDADEAENFAHAARFVLVTEESLADQALACVLAETLRSRPRIVEKAECLGKFRWLRVTAMLSSKKSDAADSLWGVGRLRDVKRGNAAWGRKNRHV
jgi:hypothetical protein